MLNSNGGGPGNIITLSSEGGPHTPAAGNNFNFSGSVAGGSAANGAIEFITPGGPGAATDGQMDAVVLTDNVTIHINGSNKLAATGAVGQTITGDTGGPLSPTAGNWNIISNVASNGAGSSVLFSGSVSTLTLNVTDANSNTCIGSGSGNATFTGALNCGYGHLCMSAGPSASANCAYGNESLSALGFGFNNTCAGYQSGKVATTMTQSCGFGFQALKSETTGDALVAVGCNSAQSISGTVQNCCVGHSSLGSLLTGSYNTTLGALSGNSYTSSESSNLLLGSTGTTGESNVIRIGTQGSGNGQQNTAFMAGVVGVTVSNAEYVTINSSTGQLGVTSSIINTLRYTAVNHAASPYTVLSTDDYLGVTTTAGVVSILLPNTTTTGHVIIVKDTAGNSATNAITVTTVGGAVTIDGATSYTIGTNYEAIQLIFNGTSYEVF